MTGGTYTLLVKLDEAVRIEVGALGDHAFPAGWYAYAGSAVGPGGFARVDRHREIAAGVRDVRHWHVDFLLGHPSASVRDAVRSRGVEAECVVAKSLPDGPVDGYGASTAGARRTSPVPAKDGNFAGSFVQRTRTRRTRPGLTTIDSLYRRPARDRVVIWAVTRNQGYVEKPGSAPATRD